MKHKIIIVAVFLLGGTSLFAQTQKSAQTEPKAEIKTSKPAKSRAQNTNESKATPLNLSKQPSTIESRGKKQGNSKPTNSTF